MITIVTDSSAYIKEAEALAWGVRVIPIRYTVDGINYSESYSDRNGNFESLIKYGEKAATVQPDTAAYARCFKEIADRGGEALCITISARLSGIYSTACAAARQTARNSVTVFDSKLTAGGLYLLVKIACGLAGRDLPMAEMLNTLEETRERITVAFTVADIGPLRNSGRISLVRRSVETILNIKPLLYLKEGAIVFDSIARGDLSITKKLTRSVSDCATDVVINYIGNSALAANLYNVLAADKRKRTVSLHKMGPVLGIHLGLNVVAVSFIT